MRRPGRLIPLAGALAGVLLIVGGCRRSVTPPPSLASPPVVNTSEGVPVVLFFVDEDGRLRREIREVAALPLASQARIRLIVEELLAGSKSSLATPIPWAVSVRSVFVDRSGSAFIDFSAPSQPDIAGTSAELAFVYAVVNSVVANCPGVQRVQLLFGGKEVATFGNIDLSRPLAPSLDSVAL